MAITPLVGGAGVPCPDLPRHEIAERADAGANGPGMWLDFSALMNIGISDNIDIIEPRDTLDEVLQYLITSKARRRLLVLLWGEHARGSVAELAKRASVGFATAHAELREMQRLQLVRSEQLDRSEVFAANPDHPSAAVLRALIAAEVTQPLPPAAGDELCKRQLVALGAPLRGVEPVVVDPSEYMDVLARGMTLARHAPVVARVVPLVVWKLRESINGRDLGERLHRPADRHVAGFFLELTSVLGEDRRLLGIAESLRDRRVTSVQPFFQVPTTSRRPPTRSFPIAEKWGFEMNVDLDAFRTLFDKYVKR
jgi:hypothetical protein